MIPLISEPITVPATVRHAANIVKNITKKLNPDQDTIITAAQPVHVLKKQLQWMYPDEFNNIICMLGLLHIEQNFLKLLETG